MSMSFPVKRLLTNLLKFEGRNLGRTLPLAENSTSLHSQAPRIDRIINGPINRSIFSNKILQSYFSTISRLNEKNEHETQVVGEANDALSSNPEMKGENKPQQLELKSDSTEKVKEADPNAKNVGRFLIGFTCKVCKHRQYKSVSKRAYNEGVVLIKCDGCQNRHLFADHLGWFRDSRLTIEDLMKENGEEVVKIANDGLLDVLGTDEKNEVVEKLKEMFENDKTPKK